MFIFDAWYIAAEASEVSAGIVARTILSQPVVLYRTQAGKIAALEYRCPHRIVPLSLGEVTADNLRCLYHGAEFRPDGTCAKVPGQKAVPNNVQVRSCPVIERYGYCWIWMGAPGGSVDESTLPDGYWMSDSPDWHGAYGLFQSMQADYRLFNDNIIDVTHAEFVHPGSLGGEEVQYFRNARQGDEYIDRGMAFTIKERSLQFRLAAKGLGEESAPILPQMIAESRGLEEYNGRIDFTLDVDWWAPSYCRFLLGARPSDEPQGPMATMCNLHAGIPESETSTHYFYRSMRNYGDDSTIPAIKQVADFIFGQDKPVLEAQQKKLGDRDLLDLRPISFAGDRLPLEARRILKKMAEDQVAMSHH